MITISGMKRHTAGSTNNEVDYDFKGLSTDTKPTENVAYNSLFLELDTGDFYYFNGTDWAKVVGGGGGGGGGGGDIPLPVSISNGGTGATTAPQARINLGIYSKDEVDALIPTDLSQLSNTTTNYINNTQLDEALDALGRIFTLKGSVPTANDLPSTGNTIGDVYYVSGEDKSYVWINDNGTEKWYQLSGTINTENFLTKTGLLNTTGNSTDNTMSQAAITTALNAKANTTDIPTDLSQLSNSTTNYVNMSQVQSVIPTQLTQLGGTLPISKGGTGATTAAAARSNLNVYTKERLYNNSSGSSGTITLSTTANNYNWLEIHYSWSSIYSSVVMIPNTSGSRTVNVSLSYLTGAANQLIVRSALIYVNGRSITWGRNKSTLFNIGGKSETTNEPTLIHQVYGFKH